MNVLLLPSWYPVERNDLSGIFFKEQALLVARHSDITMHIMVWGQERSYVSVRKPVKLLTGIFRTRLSKVHTTTIGPRAIEYRFKAASWNEDLFHGNMKAIAKRISDIAREITERYGEIDVIHAHVSYPAGYLARLVSARTGIPYIMTEHMGPFPFPRFLTREGRLKPVISEALRYARCVTAVSCDLAGRIRAFGERVDSVTPNFIDGDFFAPPDGTAGSKKTAQRTVLTICALRPAKGLEEYLEAIAIAVSGSKADFDGTRFRIGGDGPETYKSYLLKKAEDLGISDRITWLGSLSREQALLEYQSCDVFALASRLESFGVVYIEALACGKPILATDCGGPADIVTSANGVLVKTADPHSIADGLSVVVRHIGEYNSELIRRDFLGRFSASHGAYLWKGVYQSIVGD